MNRNGSAEFARNYLSDLCGVLGNISTEDLQRVIGLLEEAYQHQRTVFIAGNGGSASTASHMASDLSKTVVNGGGREGFRTIALTDNVPLMTAWGNDASYEEIFAGQIRSLARPEDLLILISGSGNSKNLLRVVETARSKKLVVIALLGKGGGQLRSLVDAAVVVPSDDYGPIEDAHLAINHLLTAYFRQKLFSIHAAI